MSRRAKIWTRIAVSAVVFAALLLLIGIEVIRSAWFAKYVSEKIVSVVEQSTGGRAELGTFGFDWKHLHARVTNFILHGKEPAGQAPLLRVDAIELRLELLPSFTKTVDLKYLGLDQPVANVIVFPDGTTNIPEPKVPSKSDKSALATIVDLAIHQFDLNRGSVIFAEQKIPLAAHGRDLRAQLFFNAAKAVYNGEISFDSVQLSQQGRLPLTSSVKIPVTIDKDRIEVESAVMKTAESSLTVSGSLTNLEHPVVAAHAIAHISLSEVHRTTGIASGACVKGRPCFADADVEARVDQQKLAISKAAVSMGRSRLRASGGRDAVSVEGSLAMEEIGGVFQFPGDSIGDVTLTGTVKAMNDRIDLQGMRIEGMGGRLIVDGSLKNYETFELRGKINGFQIADLERRFLSPKPGYDGAIAGTFDASGNLARPGISGIHARTQLEIAPAAHGVPLKGRIDAEYEGATNNVKIARATISLPHSVLAMRGVLGIRMDADFSTTDTRDLYPAMAEAMKDPPAEFPLTLNGGKLELHARADGPLASPSITANISVDRFAVEKRAFDHLIADATATQKGFSIQNGSLTRSTMQANFSGSAGLRDWTLTNDQPVRLIAALGNAELPDLLALAGQPAIPASGKLNASLEAKGTVGNPLGIVSVSAANGSLYGETFQTLELQASMSDQLVWLTRAAWIGPAGTIQATGTYTHPRDTFLSGDLQVHAASNLVRLSTVANVTKRHPGIDGILQLNLDTAAAIRQEKGETEMTLTSVRGDVRVYNLRDQAKSYGNFTAHADTSGSTVSFLGDSNLSGSAIHIKGQTTLTKDYPITADVSVQNLAVENLPFDLGIPVKGVAAITGHAQGTLHAPVVTAKLSLSRGAVDNEPIDKLQATGRYTSQLIEIESLQVTSPAGSATLNGSFAHPADQFSSGTIQLHLATGDLRVDRIQTVQLSKSGLGGTLTASMDFSGDLKTVKGQREIAPSQIDATAALGGITYDGHQAGNAKLTAKTSGGTVSVALDSDMAHAAIHAEGEVKLIADYPVTARFSARDLRLSHFKPFLNVASLTQNLEAVAEVEGSISGSARKLDELRGDIRIPHMEADAHPCGNRSKPVSLALRNEGPIEAQLDRSVLTIRSAHVVGPRGTDIVVAGTIGFAEKNPLYLTIKANADLGLLQDIDKDFYSSGTVSMDASLRGSFSAPLANGSVQLKNASVNMVGFSNGISNANGTISLAGSSATIRDLTGESGGGKITVSGFAGYTGGALRYSLRANANRVRTRQQGVSIVNNAALTVSGTSAQSLVSGTVTVVSVGINPQSDVGSILSSSTAAQVTDDQTSPLLSNTRLDIRIRTAPDVRFQSTLAQDLQAEADVTLVGTVANPGMTGRIEVTEGDLIFFGNQYTVNHGVISFYNPLRIEPQLNVSLETTVKSVDVVLTLTGPMENLKLSYRSDPPLQFDEIVALLATGRRPSSDPTIVANEAAPPQQSVGQLGETAIVSQAIASPVSSRLQRVFGVTQLSIDPTFASGSALPQASLTLQQRVATNVTFTYAQDYSQSNSELVRVEWTISPRFSAVATRDINGIFGVDFFYKRQFR
jgi:translocation and assembly module TamB